MYTLEYHDHELSPEMSFFLVNQKKEYDSFLEIVRLTWSIEYSGIRIKLIVKCTFDFYILIRIYYMVYAKINLRDNQSSNHEWTIHRHRHRQHWAQNTEQQTNNKKNTTQKIKIMTNTDPARTWVHPRCLVGSVLLIFLVFCVVLLYVFTFWVPCYDDRYEFCIKTMFGSSLPPVVCRKDHVLFTLFVFVLCVVVSSTVFCFCCVFLRLLWTVLTVSLDFPSANVYLIVRLQLREMKRSDSYLTRQNVFPIHNRTHWYEISILYSGMRLSFSSSCIGLSLTFSRNTHVVDTVLVEYGADNSHVSWSFVIYVIFNRIRS